MTTVRQRFQLSPKETEALKLELGQKAKPSPGSLGYGSNKPYRPAAPR